MHGLSESKTRAVLLGSSFLEVHNQMRRCCGQLADLLIRPSRAEQPQRRAKTNLHLHMGRHLRVKL